MVLHKFPISDVTLVQNKFIDEYMPSANGEFVKIYLYLLRCSAADKDVSLSSIADDFNHTESDIRRALSYWEKQSLLHLTYEGDELTDISFTDIAAAEAQKAAVHAAQPTQTDPAYQNQTTQKKSKEESRNVTERGTQQCTVSTQRMKELAGEDDIKQILFVVEQLMGRTLTTTEIRHILYFYDELHFSVDLIEYLIEYCVSKDKRGIPYIRKVAMEWAKHGIRTVADAKKEADLYHTRFYAVLRAFGIKDRGPAQAELAYISRWLYEWNMPIELILEACNRTITNIHTPDFRYTEKILSDWKELGIHQPEDIEKLDRPAEKKDGTKNSGFNGFPQRAYDYDALEKLLEG